VPTHDIIDNRNEKLVDHIKRILSSTERARVAVGYFFLSGLTSIKAGQSHGPHDRGEAPEGARVHQSDHAGTRMDGEGK
jgi:hypothetical protein